MTNTEFKNEFDIAYNNIRSNSAPGIDSYELSVFLTKSQEEIVFNYFNPLGNKYRDGFENTTKRRKDLKKLVKHFDTSTVNDSTEINSEEFTFNGFKSYNVQLPSNTLFIIQEEAILDVVTRSLVIPLTHDEIMLQVKNPYRKPISDRFFTRVWRLDNDISATFEDSVEIIIPKDSELELYRMRYVKKPQPIIVTNLNSGEFEGLGLSINGQTAESNCELDSSIHRQILDRAVSLALEAFEKQRLQTQSQISSRNE